jgi:hypothetical protein
MRKLRARAKRRRQARAKPLGKMKKQRIHEASHSEMCEWGSRKLCCSTLRCCTRFTDGHILRLRKLYLSLSGDKQKEYDFLNARTSTDSVGSSHRSDISSESDDDTFSEGLSSTDNDSGGEGDPEAKEPRAGPMMPIQTSRDTGARNTYHIDSQAWVEDTFSRRKLPDRKLDLVPVIYT